MRLKMFSGTGEIYSEWTLHQHKTTGLQCPHALTPHQAVENVAGGVRDDRASGVRAELCASVSIHS